MGATYEITARLTVLSDTPRTRELLRLFLEQLEQVLFVESKTPEAEIYLEATNEANVLVVEQANTAMLAQMKSFVLENPVGSLWLDLTVQTQTATFAPFYALLTPADAEDILFQALAFCEGEPNPSLFCCSKTEERVFCGEAPEIPVQPQEVRVFPIYSHGTALQVNIDTPEQTDEASLALVKQRCSQINNRFCDEAQEYAKKDGRYRFTVEDLKFEDAEGFLFFTDRVSQMLGLTGGTVDYSPWYYSMTEDEMALLHMKIEPENKDLKLNLRKA